LYAFEKSCSSQQIGFPMPPHKLSIRKATLQDCAVILHHRRSMFRDMGEGTPAELDQMVKDSASWLTTALADGSYQGWLAEDRQGKWLPAAAYSSRPGRQGPGIPMPAGL
jgi:hypothetical protein